MGARHHTLLHRTARSGQQTEPDGETAPEGEDATHQPGVRSVSCLKKGPKCQTIFRTAIVTMSYGAYRKKVRAVLDTGSALCLVTSQLVNSLKAKKMPAETWITGIVGTSNCKHQVNLKLESAHQKGGAVIPITATVWDRLHLDPTPRGVVSLKDRPFLKGLQLADPEFQSDQGIDLLLGCKECTDCERPEIRADTDGRAKAYNSIFGWIQGGSFPSSRQVGDDGVTHCNRTSTADTELTQTVKAFWRTEEVPQENPLMTQGEEIACEHFADTHTRNQDGHYSVALPRTVPTPELGDSRRTAARRFIQNEKGLKRKGTWNQFHEGLQEYLELGHAELVPSADLGKEPRETIYLPTHGVSKDSSTTMKLRVVYDVSAKTSTGASLNDQLLPGPSLYPLLTNVLIHFRSKPVRLSADISKMFREIDLHPEERDFHRFLVRGEGGELVDARMTRLTFGVKSSPFLATQVLRQIATDYHQEFAQAAEIFQKRFYVNDCLTGADSVEEAIPIVEGTTSLCQRGGMTLRKFRTNSKELREAIPTELLETSDLNISTSPSEHGKTLGLHWDTERDVFHVAAPCLKPAVVPTKRQILSDIARTYDVMGWCAPAMVKAKIMVQRLWQQDLGWDQEVTGELAQEYHKWREQLPSLTSIVIPRCYFQLDRSRVSIQLHGFADASQAAYGGVLYMRVVYEDTSTETALIMAKSRVAPLQTKTIPKLELEGARVLAQMM